METKTNQTTNQETKNDKYFKKLIAISQKVIKKHSKELDELKDRDRDRDKLPESIQNEIDQKETQYLQGFFLSTREDWSSVSGYKDIEGMIIPPGKYTIIDHQRTTVPRVSVKREWFDYSTVSSYIIGTKEDLYYLIIEHDNKDVHLIKDSDVYRFDLIKKRKGK